MKVTWNVEGGDTIVAEVDAGSTLKDAALANDVPYVLGECGGALSCATCHVVVASEWAAAAGEASDFEEAMLDMTEAERREGSRLSCQISMNADLDGLVLTVPAV